MDFETKLKRLEEIVQKMEAGDIPLESSLKLFEEGVKLSRECQSQLSEAETQIQKLIKVEADGKAVTQNFNAE